MADTRFPRVIPFLLHVFCLEATGYFQPPSSPTMSSSEHAYERALAPWSLVGQAWMLLGNNSASLPVQTGGFYDPQELLPSDGRDGVFKGGLSSVMVVRYLESPVGPYDELIVIPGKFTTPSGKENLRISRIYVSSEASVYNGRLNWNIPKHLARFTFTSGPSGSTTVEVYPALPLDAKPFFSATFTPLKWAPSFWYNTSWGPLDFKLVQPPLPSLVDKASGAEDSKMLAGTSEWTGVIPDMRGKMRCVWNAPALKSEDGSLTYGDGVGFPKVQPWSLGAEYLLGMDLIFPESTIESTEDAKKK